MAANVVVKPSEDSILSPCLPFKIYLIELSDLSSVRLISFGILSNDPRMYIRSLDCGTPKSFEFNTSQRTLYPRLINVIIIVAKVLPLSCDNKFFTFSIRKYFGLFIFKIRDASKNNVPRVSANPFCLPATENAWQGNPNTNKSKSGNSDASIWVISPKL